MSNGGVCGRHGLYTGARCLKCNRHHPDHLQRADRPEQTDKRVSEAASAAGGATVADNNEPMPNYGIAQDFPLLWIMAKEYDFAERLGRSTSKLHAEVDSALHELWLARGAQASAADGETTADTDADASSEKGL